MQRCVDGTKLHFVMCVHGTCAQHASHSHTHTHMHTDGIVASMIMTLQHACRGSPSARHRTAFQLRHRGQEACEAHRQAMLVEVLHGPLQAVAIAAAGLNDLHQTATAGQALSDPMSVRGLASKPSKNAASTSARLCGTPHMPRLCADGMSAGLRDMLMGWTRHAGKQRLADCNASSIIPVHESCRTRASKGIEVHVDTNV